MNQNAALHEKAERLTRKLEEVRRGHAEQPEGERQAAFERILDEELGRLPAADADSVIENVRARLIQTARDRDQQVEKLEAKIHEQEITIVKLMQSQKQAAPAPTPAPAAGPAANLDSVRAALVRVAKGETPDVAELGLAPKDAALYSMISRLMQFTMSYGESRTWLLASLGVGAAANADSIMIKGMQDKTKRSMRDCLNGDLTASDTLQSELTVYAKFLIGLTESFQFSINEGGRSILGELRHQPLLEKHKRLVGFDYEAAWKELEGVHARLNDLSRGELWEQHFMEPFRKKLK